jgi:hypothetical protein
VGWYRGIFTVAPFASSFPRRIFCAFLPITSLTIVSLVLKRWSAVDVRDDMAYLLYYLGMGASWLGAASLLFPWLGISVRDDVIERGNRAATWPLSGALTGAALCFAGGNVGNGPGFAVVLFSAALSTGSFFLLWWLLEWGSQPSLSDKITIERDLPAGARLGGLLLALGIILGWAVAGDWVSQADTLRTFLKVAWPAFVLTLVAWRIEQWFVPGRKRSLPDYIPAVLYVAAALAAIGLET